MKMRACREADALTKAFLPCFLKLAEGPVHLKVPDEQTSGRTTMSSLSLDAASCTALGEGVLADNSEFHACTRFSVLTSFSFPTILRPPGQYANDN